MAVGLAWLLAGSVQARPGVVHTRTGGTYQGDVTPSPHEQAWQVTLPGGGTALVPLADLADVQFEPGTNAPAHGADRFIIFRNSAIPVPATSVRAMPTELQLDSDGEKMKVSTLDVAGILFQPGDPGQFPALKTGRPGVVLRNGDFMDGEFRGLDGGAVVLSSVLFGLRRLEIGKEAVAVVFHALPPNAARYQLRTTAGRVFCAAALPQMVDGNCLLVADPVLGDSRVPFSDIREFRTAPR